MAHTHIVNLDHQHDSTFPDNVSVKTNTDGVRTNVSTSASAQDTAQDLEIGELRRELERLHLDVTVMGLFIIGLVIAVFILTASRLG